MKHKRRRRESKTAIHRRLRRAVGNLAVPIVSILKEVYRPFRSLFSRFILGLFLAFIATTLIESVIRIDKIPSSTMLNTIKRNGFVVTYKLRYAIVIPPFVSKLTEKSIVFSNPKRGDIVLIRDPKYPKPRFIDKIIAYPIYFFTFGRVDKTRTRYLVKRIIGLPNEIIEIKDKIVYINGIEIAEPWNKTHNDTRILDMSVSLRDNFPKYIIGYNEYFVLGDNRDYNYDSRDFGNVSFGLIEGKVILH